MPEKNYKTVKKRRKKGETADEGLIDSGKEAERAVDTKKEERDGGQESMNNDEHGGHSKKR